MPAPTKRNADGTPIWLDELCRRISTGQSITAVCKAEDMPGRVTVYEIMSAEEAVRTAIARAREAQQEAIADELLEIADGIRDCTDQAQIQAARLRIWTRQWLMSKLAPKRYGDKITTEVTGPGGEPLRLEQAPDAAAKILLGFAHATLPMRKDDG